MKRFQIPLFLRRLAVRHNWLQPLLLALGLLLGAITLAANLSFSQRAKMPAIDEQFDPFLAGIDSVDEIMLVLNTAYPDATRLEKLDAADALLRRRFFHSYSYFRPEQNWIAATLRPLWADLASPVRPNDILGHRRAACSQQSLVFLEIARRLGFDYASIRAPGHFLAGVKIDGRWWAYDANMEMRARRYPAGWLHSGDPRLKTVYRPAVADLLTRAGASGKISLTSVNRFAAPQARLLHQFTDLFSRFGWLLMLGLWAGLKLYTRPIHEAQI